MDRPADKLAVILHADVAGSTELVQQDKQLAHERIRDSFQRFHNVIAKYHGQVLELRGDALLASFERGSDAVSAALAFQADQADHISRIQDEIRPQVRVGISIGEVVVADDTVTGAGVVQAQRVEQLAEPGGVCITAPVHESLSKRMPLEFESLGQKDLKGFDHAVHVYRVELTSIDVIPFPTGVDRSKTPSGNRILLLTLVVVFLISVGVAAYWFESVQPEEGSPDHMVDPLSGKPSIAVLPFSNLSSADQWFFVDGMHDTLITDLSRLSGLFVIAKNSVDVYRDQDVSIRQVAGELGVRYVIRGSVWRVENQVRINVQLIDATTGGNVTGERHDGSLEDLFAMQDKVTRGIVSALKIHLTPAEEAAPTTVLTRNSKARDAFFEGLQHYRRHTPDDFAKAIPFLELAIEFDPEHARARAALAAVVWESFRNNWHVHSLGLSYDQWVPVMARYQQEAMKRPTALAHQVASDMAVRGPGLGVSATALAEAEKAIAFDRNDPASYLARVNARLKAGKVAEAVEDIETALDLDPNYPAPYLSVLAAIQLRQGEYQDAVATLTRAADSAPKDDWIFTLLGAAYGHLGQELEAMQAVNRANELRLSISSNQLTLSAIGDDYRWIGDIKPLREGLAKAGVKSGTYWLNRVTRKSDKYVVDGAITIDVNAARSFHDQGVPFIDTGRDFSKGRIPGSHHLQWFFDGPNFTETLLLRVVDKSNALVIYGPMDDFEDHAYPAYASAMAVSWGFEKVYYFADGLPAWKAAGYPIEVGN